MKRSMRGNPLLMRPKLVGRGLITAQLGIFNSQLLICNDSENANGNFEDGTVDG